VINQIGWPQVVVAEIVCLLQIDHRLLLVAKFLPMLYLNLRKDLHYLSSAVEMLIPPVLSRRGFL
jgi:hypothetical protein